MYKPPSMCRRAGRQLIARIHALSISAVRPIPLKLITISKNNSKGAEVMANEWAAKIQRYTKLIEVNIKPNPLNAKEVEVAKNAEAERVLKSIDTNDRVILLDERGREVRSEGIAAILKAASDDGCSCITFAIGGPFGHGKAVHSNAFDTIRLSSCILNHSVARIVLLEQLYRSWTILRGEPYHH